MRHRVRRRAESPWTRLEVALARRACGALLMLCWIAFAPAAQAQEPEREVVLQAAGAEAEVRALAAVVRELLDRVSVRLHVLRAARFAEREVVSPSARAERALAAVWIDLQSAGRVRLYVYAPAQDRMLVRTIERAPASEEIVREEVAHIVHTAVEGLLSGAPVGVPRRQVFPELAPAARREAAPRRRAHSAASAWQVRLGYRAALVTSEAPAHGPVAELALRPFDVPLRPGLLMSAHYAWPLRASTTWAGADFQSSELRALATLQHALAERWLLRLGLGAGVDVVAVEPYSELARVQAAERSRLVVAAVRGALELEARVTKTLSFFGAITADVYPGGVRYVLARPSGDDAVLAPWRIRPGLLFGLAWP